MTTARVIDLDPATREVELETETPAFALRPVSASDLDRPPALSWLVRDLIPADAVGFLFGEPGAYKSFLAIDLAMCVVTGRPFHGKRVKSGAVVYIAGEGRAGLASRIRAWLDYHGVALPQDRLYISDRAARLVNASDAAAVGQAISALADVVLVIVDTLARNSGGDENSTAEAAVLWSNVETYLRGPGRVVKVVHHVGHQDKNRMRGNSLYFGNADFALRLSVERERMNGDAPVLKLEATKMKDAQLPQPLYLQPDGVALPWVDEDGEGMASVVLVDSDAPEAPERADKGIGGTMRAALDDLRRLHDEHRARIKADDGDPNQARVKVDDWKAAFLAGGHTKQTFSNVRTRLVERGLVHLESGFACLKGVHV